MKIIKPSFEILTKLNEDELLRDIELIGRVSYKSEEKMTNDSAKNFVYNRIKAGHESILEHRSIAVRFICDRGISHEIVRHRLASFTQESTRYCNYANNKFDNEITVIEPCFFKNGSSEYEIWLNACENAERSYMALLNAGAKPEEARSVLPTSLKTDIVMTANLREWRHFLSLRTSISAHPQMRELTIPLLLKLNEQLPSFFEDINSIRNK